MMSSRLPFLAVTLLAVTGLSACSKFEWPGEGQRPTVAQPRGEHIDPPEARPARAAAVERQPAKTTDKKGSVAGKAAEIDPRPQVKLVGLSEAETADLLGRPTEESGQPPGKVWVYKLNGCRLSVHLFPDMEKGGFYTLDYKADEGQREACLGKLAAAKRKE